MTSETRFLLDLADIKGIELQCHKCGATILYSFSKEFQRLAEKCPNCFEPWFHKPDGPQYEESITDQITHWITVMRNVVSRKDVYASLRLHVKSLPTS